VNSTCLDGADQTAWCQDGQWCEKSWNNHNGQLHSSRPNIPQRCPGAARRSRPPGVRRPAPPSRGWSRTASEPCTPSQGQQQHPGRVLLQLRPVQRGPGGPPPPAARGARLPRDRAPAPAGLAASSGISSLQIYTPRMGQSAEVINRIFRVLRTIGGYLLSQGGEVPESAR
jgi:hypothetical protein